MSSFILGNQTNRTAAVSTKANVYVAGNKRRTPSKAQFAPKFDRETWTNIWLDGKKSWGELAVSNRSAGYKPTDIEAAIRTEVLHRLSRNARLENNVISITRGIALGGGVLRKVAA